MEPTPEERSSSLPLSIKIDGPVPHQFGDCLMCSMEKTRITKTTHVVQHHPGPICCTFYMEIIGLWPWLFWYCSTCGSKKACTDDYAKVRRAMARLRRKMGLRPDNNNLVHPEGGPTGKDK